MPKFRALLKQQLFELLSELFLEWLEVRERTWTKQKCPHCKQPLAYPDAVYCAFCGVALRATEPALCVIEQQPTTDPLRLPVGEFSRIHHAEKGPDVGYHTQITRAIRKVQLQKEPLR